MDATLNGVQLDGKLYHVRLAFDTYLESFRLIEGPNAGDMLSGRHERDLLGTEYSHQFGVEMDPANPEDYDEFYHAISAPVASHTVVVPHGQGVLSYQAMVQSGQKKLRWKVAGKLWWYGLVVNYSPLEPQRTPD